MHRGPSYQLKGRSSHACALLSQRTQLPVGGVRKLADNFLVSSLSEVVSRQRPPKYPLCDFCKLLAGRERDAATKCLDCVKMLCASCTHQHRQTKVTSSHSLVDIDIEKVSRIQLFRRICSI